MVIAVLLRVLLASMPIPFLYTPLAVDKPSAILSVQDNATCASLQPAADILATTTGFSRATLSCSPVPMAAFSGRTEPKMPVVQRLIGYTAVASGRRGFFQIKNGFELPGNVRYVTGVAEIDAYVNPDAIVLYTQSDNKVAAAFALERAGINRKDIAEEGNAIVVRARPPDDAEIAAISDAVRSSGTTGGLYGEIAYLYDCRKVEDSLTGLALEEAHNHARTLAHAAGGTIGALLGVVDGGGEVLDGTCGGGPSATLQELAALGVTTGPVRLEFGAYITVRRRITAAWQLNGRPKAAPPTTGRQFPVDGSIRINDVVNAFQSEPVSKDRRSTIGSAILANAVQPDCADVIADEWTYEHLRARYGAVVRRIISFAHPKAAVSIASQDPEQLKQRIADIRQYLAGLEAETGQRTDVFYTVSRADCEPQVEAALFYAARDAMGRLHGHEPRYLKEQLSDAIGFVPCSFSPIWASDGVIKPLAELSGSTLASVVAGY